MTPLAPALLAAAATGLAVAPDPARRLGRLDRAPRTGRAWTQEGVLAAGAGCCALFGLALFGLSRGLLVAAGGVLAAVVAQLLLQRRAATRQRRSRQAVARAARVLGGQLRIGQVPTAALASAASDCAPLERAAATLAIGGDVAASLRALGAEPGHEGLATLSMAWELSERSGAPISALVRQVSDALHAEEQTRAQVEAELSGPRASGRLLACLPALGLAMGSLAGGNPLHFLASSLFGHACILGAVVLAGAGVLWTEHLATSVQK